ncbi:MAG TPA: hypothetical protein ACHBY5_15375, partial [Arsenophonus apicola]
ALNDPAVMRGLLLNYSEKILERDHQIAEMKPDIAALERIPKSNGPFLGPMPLNNSKSPHNPFCDVLKTFWGNLRQREI